MKKIAGLIFLFLGSFSAFAQIKIHSHNDYLQSTPFFKAYQQEVYEIEADIFLVGDSLVVAHSKKEIDPTRTLDKLYLKPIVALFKENNGYANSSKHYTFCLMVDVKESWQTVYPVLKRTIEQYGAIFDRSKNKHAIQIVISGSRPADSTFHTYPNWLFFDGLPNVNYAKEDLKRVTMISDNFANYSKWNGTGTLPDADKAKLQATIHQGNQLSKPVRFWGAPDTVASWEQLQKLGATIINTDKIEACKAYFKEIK